MTYSICTFFKTEVCTTELLLVLTRKLSGSKQGLNFYLKYDFPINLVANRQISQALKQMMFFSNNMDQCRTSKIYFHCDSTQKHELLCDPTLYWLLYNLKIHVVNIGLSWVTINFKKVYDLCQLRQQTMCIGVKQ